MQPSDTNNVKTNCGKGEKRTGEHTTSRPRSRERPHGAAELHEGEQHLERNAWRQEVRKLRAKRHIGLSALPDIGLRPGSRLNGVSVESQTDDQTVESTRVDETPPHTHQTSAASEGKQHPERGQPRNEPERRTHLKTP